LLLASGWASAQEVKVEQPPADPAVIGLPPIPPPPPAVFPSQNEERRETSLAGIHGGRVFVRDPRDVIRIYPGARFRTDFYHAPGAPKLPTREEATPSNPLGPNLFVRSVDFDVSGELFRRLMFTAGVRIGGSRIGNTDFAGPSTSRFAMASAHDGKVVPTDVNLSYLFRRWLNLTAGMQLLPFSMSNRTPDHATATLERPLAIRGFVVPWDRDLGLTMWGEAAPREFLHYELGIFAGDGYEHPFADTTPDFAGRIYTRPLSTVGKGSLFQKAQLGFSARVGGRDHRRVTYDYPTTATNQGWVLWQPGYVDSIGRVTHVLPSGVQRALGGELRLPFDLPGGRAIDVESELYYLHNDTREAVAGFVATNTERFGRVKGIGWYAQVSFWLCGDAFANGDPGVTRPVTVELERPSPIKRGLEVVLIASGIRASYDGASRESSPEDPRTPRSQIDSYQFGGGAQYWFGANFRGSLQYMAYFAPNSGEDGNLVLVPRNVPDRDGEIKGGHSHHELAIRMAAGF
jgi:hypothetical protein